MSAEELNITHDEGESVAAAGLPDMSAGLRARAKSLKQGNLVLVMLFAAGAACVYLLSLRSGPSSASAQQEADEIRVASVLEQFQVEAARRGLPAGRARALVDTFYYETRQRQIPAEQLAGNPFEFRPPRGEQAIALDGAAGKTGGGPPRATSLGEAMAAVKQLRLQSVLAGPGGATAMISNNLICEGQVIQGWKVVKISPQSVLLSYQDQTYELRMQ